MAITEEEKKKMMEDMDAAAIVAEEAFKAMPQTTTAPVARWWLEHYAKAGHKRLGRMMVTFAKNMANTKPKDLAK